MTDVTLLRQLRRDEGLRLTAYPDPRSPRAKTGKGSGAPWTIGYGHTGPEVREGLQWTKAQAEAALEADVERHNAELAARFPWVARLPPARRRVLQNMAFNMGVEKLAKFHATLAAAKAGDWATAAHQMQQSAWYGQVGSRAVRLVETMRTGIDM